MPSIDLSTLNAEQRRIVTMLDEPVFVEAGAGSGKTFTLTRRIAWALASGSGANGEPYLGSLSEALVITFTNAAAREIKERVRSTLREAGMTEAALEVDSAWISTIHGMCSRILKRHALDLGLDPAFKLANENQARALRNAALEQVVGEAYRDPDRDEALTLAFDTFQYGSLDAGSGVVGVVSHLLSAANAAPNGFDDLVAPPAGDVSDVMSSLARSLGSLAGCKLTAKAAEKVVPSLAAVEAFTALPPGARTAEAAREALDEVSLPRPSKAIAEYLDEARRELALAQTEVGLALVRPCAEPLIELARRVDARYMELKLDQSILDNDDLIGLALHAVRDDPTIRADYEGRFRLVMVDEFQDTDAKQLELISLLAGRDASHLATVGDAQQSIYRFRGADVDVFRSRGAGLPPEEHVRLDVNYRSHADVLSLVDKVCGGDAGVLDGFMHLDPSETRKNGYKASGLPRIDVELTVGKSGTSKEQVATQAAAIADRLRAYADAGQEPGKMTLLLRSMTNAKLYIDAIRARGLECVVAGGSGFTKTPEVAVVRALLHTLANERDTQTGLFPLLASEMFDLAADDFVALGTRPADDTGVPGKRGIDRGIRSMELPEGVVASERLRRAFDVIDRARSLMRHRPVADACLQAIRESGWLARLEAMGTAEGMAREANVLAAVDYVRQLTSDLGLGPATAAVEFDAWLDMAKISPSTLAGDGIDAVRIMTVHASKGLEFDVVALAECWANPRADAVTVGKSPFDGKTQVVLAHDLKARLDPADIEGEPETLAEWYAFLRDANATADAAELTRLLYVGLTRAKEALVLGLSGYSTKERPFSPDLAAGVADALFGGCLPPVGESVVDYGGTQPAHVRRIDVTRERGAATAVAVSEGALAGFDGDLPELARIPSLGCDVPVGDDVGFAFYDVPRSDLMALTTMRASREDVFSYSSAHALMREAAIEAGREVGHARTEDEKALDVRADLPTRAERDADQEGAPIVLDSDRATNLGSAFHELAQVMVETGHAPTPERVEALAAYWRISGRARARLDLALEHWASSSIRREALGYGRVLAEVPFFCDVRSSYGRYVEGAIDLLATDPGSESALVVDYKTGDRGLTASQIQLRHEMQANFYAYVLMGQGYERVECAFVCVELANDEGEPFVARYAFDADNPPTID